MKSENLTVKDVPILITRNVYTVKPVLNGMPQDHNLFPL
jgi:hypothetical protein